MSTKIWTNTFLCLVAALLLLVALVSSAHICEDGCEDNFNGFCYAYPDASEFCSCRSGNAGSNCSETVNTTVCELGHVNTSATGYVPSEVTAVFTGDTLTVTVTSPLVAERNYTVIAIDEDAADDWNCTYPGLYWGHALDGCNDSFVGTMPWQMTKHCGWVLDNSDPNDYIYTANMTVEQHDFVNPFGGRDGAQPVESITTSVVPLQLKFQKNVAVSTSTTVQANIQVLVAIPLQRTSAADRTATVQISTNVVYPYKLTSPQLTSPSLTGGSASVNEITSGTCPNDASSSCTQLWQIDINAGTECSFSGDYLIQFTITCQLNGGNTPASCAINPGDTATIAATLTSENLCGLVSRAITISGSVASYRDSAHTVAKTNFFIGQTIYWNAVVTSPDATLESSQIYSVKLTAPNHPDRILYTNGTTNFAAANFALDSASATSAAFHFTLADSFINTIDADSLRMYTLVARVDVTYSGVPGSRKRVVLSQALNGQQIALNSVFASQPAPLVPANAPLIHITFAILIAILATFL